MRPSLRLFAILLILLLINVTCRDAEVATPTATTAPTDLPPTDTPATDTPPTDAPTPTAEAPDTLGIAPLGADDVTPEVIARYPSVAEELALDGEIALIFDQPMDQAQTAAAFSIVDDGGQAIAGSISWPQPRQMLFKPAARLAPATRYEASLAETAASVDGVPFASGLSFNFSTIGPLAVTALTPADGSSEVDGDTAITVIFNRPVVPLRIGQEQNFAAPIRLEPAVEGEGEWVNTSVFVFRPDSALLGGETYRVTVDAAMVNSASVSGSELAEDISASFSVRAPGIVEFGLRDARYFERFMSVRNNHSDMPLDQPFQIFFEQPMDAGSVAQAVSLSPEAGGESVDFDYLWLDDNRTVIMTPTALLQLDTRYRLTVSDDAKAANGSPIRNPLSWTTSTVPAPAVRSTEPADGAAPPQHDPRFVLHFSAPMDADSLVDRVIFDPPLRKVEPHYDEFSNSLRFFNLEPSTDYVVTLLPGMSDPYGNQIITEQTIRFSTGRAQPALRFNLPSNQYYYGTPLALYREGGSNALWLTHRNLDDLEIALYRPTLNDFIRFFSNSSNSISPRMYRAAAEQRVRSFTPTLDAEPDSSAFERFLLQEPGGRPLTPGIYFASANSTTVPNQGSVHDDGLALIVANANLTLKTTATEALIWLTDLNSGEPLAGVDVQLYNESGVVVWSGVTDEDGVAYSDELALNVPDFKNYFAITDDAEVFGFSISNWSEGVQPWELGIATDFYMQPNQPVAYIYSDRPLYRPGQEVNFKGILRLNDDLDYSIPEFDSVLVQIASFEETIYRETLPLSPFGSFEGSVTFDDEAALGDYRIWIELNDRYLGETSFGLAEYRKPTFQVNVATDREAYTAGETIAATVNATFFSGGSVVNGDVSYFVSAEDYFFSPTQRELRRFSFYYNADDFFFDPFGFRPQNVIASGVGVSDGGGNFAVSVPARLPDDAGSKRFMLEATVDDVGGNSVSGRNSAIVHAGEIYVGVAADSSIGIAAEEMSFDVVTVDWDGETVRNRDVTVVFVRREWMNVQEQDSSGRTIWRSTVRDTPVMTETVTTGSNGQATVTFTPPDGGSYQAIASVADNSNRRNRGAAGFWVISGEFISWQQRNDDTFDLVSDRDSYAPGETAQLLIAHPFSGETTALVTVERGHIKYQDVVRLSSNSTLYELPLTADMAPNVFVSVLVIKGATQNAPPSFKVGITEIAVEREQQALTVAIEADQEILGPGDDVMFTVRVSDADGQPVAAELSLALADLAALSLAPRRELPMLDFFYSPRWLSVQTALLLTRLMDNFNAELEEEIKGGGGGGGDLGVITIREDFPDTAFWEGQLTTDGDGEATVTITLPDSLTTWRMDARAVTADTRVGEATHDIRTTRPLLVAPYTPRFFINGDRAQVGTLVHNNSGEALDVDVSLSVEGAQVRTPATQSVTVPAGQQIAVTWDLTIGDGERVDLAFSANSGEFADASRSPVATLENGGIPVYRYEAPETVGTSGQLLQGGAVVESLALPLFDNWQVSEGEVSVQIEPSLAAAMTDGLDFLEHYPYECTEQVISKFLPNVVSTRALREAGVEDRALTAELERQVGIALQKLYSRQRSDGSWCWWDSPTCRGDSLVTAWVLLGLLEARDAGYTVSDGVITNGTNYLVRRVATVDELDGRFKANRQAFVEYVLARLDRSDAGRLESLYERRNVMDIYAQALLTQAIAIFDAEDPRLDGLIAELTSAAVLSATGAHWEESARDYWNWNTDTRTTAIVLDTLAQLQPESPIVANSVRWLMAHRDNGHWSTTQETAWTLLGLTEWMIASGELEADYLYEVALNGVLLGSGEATSANLREAQRFEVDITELSSDALNRLAIGRSEGGGNLYYTTHMNISLPVDQIEPVEQGIIVSRSYYRADDRRTPISSAQQGETLLARLTIVAPNTLHYVVIDDWLPAGLEAIDTSLLTSPTESAPSLTEGNVAPRGGLGWWHFDQWYFDHVELRDERVVISADLLPPGTYEYVYLVRASSPGEYQTIPPTAQEFYFPEVYGRGAGMLFSVTP